MNACARTSDEENVVALQRREPGHLVLSDEERGLASVDIVACIDDATAERDWIENLVKVYKETGTIAVGGDVQPNWQAKNMTSSRGILLAGWLRGA